MPPVAKTSTQLFKPNIQELCLSLTADTPYLQEFSSTPKTYLKLMHPVALCCQTVAML